VYYENPSSYPKSPSAPTEIGSYNVTFDVAAAGNYRDAANLPVGTLVIKEAEEGARKPVWADFNIDGLGVKDYLEGEVYYAVKISVKDPADGNPLITIRYGGRSDVPGVKGDAVGTHVVTFDVAAGGNFLSESGIWAGEITITQGEEINAGNISKYFDISGLSQVYANTPREVKITPKYGYAFLQTIMTYTGTEGTRYGPSGNAPSASGKYAVTFSAWGGGFKTANNLPAGTLTIDAAASSDALTINDFEIVGDGPNPWNTKYNLTKDVVISVAPKADKKGDIGVITVKYLKSDETGPPTIYSPKNVGYYAVTFDVSASVKYAAATLSAGTLTINKADDPIEQWDMDIVGLEPSSFDDEPKEVKITVKSLGYSPPARAVWYDGSNTPPKDAGEYEVTYDIILNDNWAGQSRIPAGTLIIQKASPARSNFGNAVLTDQNKIYDNKKAEVTPHANASGVLASGATKGLLFINKATGAKVTEAVNAGTYEVYLTLANDDKNWLPTDGDGIPLGQELTIRKRTAINADFDLVGTSRLDQVAYSISQVQFMRVAGRQPVEYPVNTAFRADFYKDSNATAVTPLTTVQAMAGGDLVVRINLPTNQENWNGGQLEWPFVVKDNTFTSADEFVIWYNGLRAGNTVYEAKFRTSPSAIDAAGIKKIALAIKDIGEYGTGANIGTTYGDYMPTGTPDNPINPKFTSTVNTNKRLSLILSGTSITAGVAITGAGNGFEGCENLRAVDLSNVTGVSPQTSPITAIDANTFAGCGNLETLKLGPVTSLGTEAASFISGLGNLKNLQLDGAVTPFTSKFLGEAVSLDMLTVNALTFAANSFELSKVKGLTLGSGASLGSEAFLNSKSLAKVVFPENYDSKNIPARAFKGCAALKDITFPTGSWNSATIDDGAFDGCSILQTVKLPIIPGTSIHANAFGGEYAALTYLTLGENLVASTAAFAGKKNLREVTLNDEGSTVTHITSVTNLANDVGVFEGCTRLRTVRFPKEGFVYIGDRAFKGCEQLVTDLPDTLDDANVGIGISAFEDCASIESITIPQRITFIQSNAFKNTGLKELTIPQTVQKILVGSFENCKYLEKVTLANTGSSPTTLGQLGRDDSGDDAGASSAGCVKLDTFGPAGTGKPVKGVCEIPATLLIVRKNTFKDTAFSKVLINSVGTTNVVGEAFSVSAGKTSNIATLEITGDALSSGGYQFGGTPNNVPSIKKIIWDIDGMAAGNTFAGTTASRLVVTKTISSTGTIAGTFPSTLKELEITKEEQVANNALFSGTNLNSLRTVIIGTDPEGEAIQVGNTSAGPGTAKVLNDNVNTITFTGKVGTLGDKFSDNLTPGDGTTDSPYIIFNFEGETGEIGASDALGDDNIQIVNLGAGVTNVNATENFTSTELVAINVASGNTKYANVANDGVLYGLDANRVRTSLIRYPAKKVLDDSKKEYTIYSTVTDLEDKAFSANQDIKILNIGTNVANIGDNVFDNMATGSLGLREVNFNATRLSDAGFATTSQFPSFVNEVTIGTNVTRIPVSFKGTSITKIIIHENVVDMAAGAFMTCTSLANVKFYAKKLNDTSTGAFSGVASVVNLEIGDDVTVIPADTFKGTMIVMPITLKNIVTIGSGAFSGCTKLTGPFDIPESCMTIGDTAFADTTSLTGVYLRRHSPTRTFIAALTAFRAPGGTGYGQLKTLYDSNGAGYYAWEQSSTPANFGWLYKALPELP
jgi:hypothetical protein